MKANRKTDTRPEIALRSALHAAGLRFRKDLSVRLPGRRPTRINIAFTKVKVAVYVDGCFWHACPDHATTPAANRTYWEPKLARNVQRDRETDTLLTAQDLRHPDGEHHPLPVAAAMVTEVVHAARPDSPAANRSTAATGIRADRPTCTVSMSPRLISSYTVLRPTASRSAASVMVSSNRPEPGGATTGSCPAGTASGTAQTLTASA
jgi:DNA mismatch endonuclease (patch repair protein)